MFTVQDRTHLREHVLQLARSDPPIVAGAIVDSLASAMGIAGRTSI